MSFQPDDLILNDCYRIEALVGRGAFAEVYRATHLPLNAVRALKVLRRDVPGLGSTEYSDYHQRFQLEAQLGAQLDRPNVIRIYDFQPFDKTLVLVMEYASGGSLLELLRTQRQQQAPLPVAEAVRIGTDVAEGLAALHDLDVVHRDLKPSNILFDAQGRAKVADLGLAQIAHGPSLRSQLSQPLPHPGTPAYMSPEQRTTGDYLTSASDIFTLGVVLFEMLTGRMYRNLPPATRARALRPDVPIWLDNALARMLDENPEARPWDGAAAAACLRAPEKPSPPVPVIPVTFVEARPTVAPQHATPPIQSLPVPVPVRQPAPTSSTMGAPGQKAQTPWALIAGAMLFLAVVAGGLMWLVSDAGRLKTPTVTPIVETRASAMVAIATPTKTLTPVAAEVTPPATPTLTPTRTPTVTVTPSQTPTKTSTPPAVLLYEAVPLDAIANAAWDHFRSPPQGEIELDGVPFNLSSRIFKSQATSEPHNAYPIEAVVNLRIAKAQHVSLLLTAGNAFARYNGRQVGEVWATCDGVEYSIATLELGRNLREWHTVGAVVTDAPETQVVWRGTLADFPNLTGHIDMLTLPLPVACQEGTLTMLRIRDLSTETLDSLDPALNFIGLAVAYYD